MKKVVFQFIVLFIGALVGFFVNDIFDRENESKDLENEKVEIEVDYGIYYDKDWNNEVLTYKQPIVANAEVAVEMASIIFNEVEIEKENMGLVSVFFDEVNEIWIVTFGDMSGNAVGGCVSIAMQKSDGKVLRVWLGE